MLGSDIGYLHHVGHVVRDMQQARDLYQKLGFACPAPAYPTLARHADQPATPFGAANTHATFGRNFVDLLTLVTDRSRIPEDARPVPLHVPPAALPGVVASIERTLAQVSASLARLEGLHIVVFQTEDADASVRRFDLVGVGHGDAYTVQRPGDSGTGQTTIPVRLVEIDAEDAPEGRLAVAENPSTAAHPVRPDLQHPNGAVDLIEAMLCVADAEIDRYVQRYQRYLGRPATQRRADTRLRFAARVRADRSRQRAWGYLAGTIRGVPASVCGVCRRRTRSGRYADAARRKRPTRV